MHWILLSLLAPFIYAGNSFVDKYVLRHKIKGALPLPIYSASAALILGVFVWLFAGFPLVGQKNTSLLLASGCCTLFALALYFYALVKNHTSYIIALLMTMPLFTLVLSAIFLNQPLNAWQVVGFFVTLLAVIGLSLNRNERRLKFDRAFLAIMAANLLFAVAAILITFTDSVEFVPILIYQCFGLAIGGAILFVLIKPIRAGFLKTFRDVGLATLTIMLANESLFSVANALTYLAISFGPVALVTVLGGTQIFYGLLMGAVFSTLFPRTFSEDITGYGLIKKVLFSVLLFTGVGVIAISSG